MQEDTRNVIDTYKGMSHEAIINDLETKRVALEIAVENLERDFNMGTIVRNANACNVSKVHVVGRRQWNKRGAMKTDAYVTIEYHDSTNAFLRAMGERHKNVIAIDIVPDAKPLHEVMLPLHSVLVFGSEKSGLSQELLEGADAVVMIEQFGSTRSMNVGVASGIAMYAWMQQHVLPPPLKHATIQQV